MMPSVGKNVEQLVLLNAGTLWEAVGQFVWTYQGEMHADVF